MKIGFYLTLLAWIVCAHGGPGIAGISPAQSSRTAPRRIDPQVDRPVRNEPILPGYIPTKFVVWDIATHGTLDVWVLAGSGVEPKYSPRPIVLRSTDGGATWSKSVIVTGLYHLRVTFVDHLLGWMTGGGGLILKTTDGGINWNRQKTHTESSLCFVQFLDANRGWVAGEDGEFLRTSDGGANWRSYKLGGHGWVGDEFRGWLNQFNFSDSSHGWFVGDNSKVFATTDGGMKWRSSSAAVERCVKKQKNQKLNVTDVHFFNSQRGVLLADLIDQTPDGELHHSFVLKTENSGMTWEKIWEPKRRKGWEMEYGPFNCLNFINETEGWITAGFGRGLFHTTDGGHNWQNQNVPGVDPDNLITGGIGRLLIVDSSRGWGSISINDFPLLDKVVRTTDAGRSWQDVGLLDVVRQ